MTADAPTRQARLRLARAGIVAPVAFALGVVIADLTWPGYSHRTMNISDLGGTAAPVPVLQNVNFVVFGLLVVAFAVALRRSWRDARGAMPLLVGGFGAMMAVQGLTPCTPGCAEGTPVDLLHVLSGVAGFLAVVVAMLLAGSRARSAGRSVRYAGYARSSAAVTLTFLVAWLAASGVDADRFSAGLLQRLAAAPVLAWLAVTGVLVVRFAERDHDVVR